MVFGSCKKMSRKNVKTRRLDEDDGSKLETEEAEDRLSKLPDDILLHILSLLDDTKLAVQTSVLGKRWRNVWTLLSIFYFDDITHYFSKSAFSKFLPHVLMRRDQSVQLSHVTFNCVRLVCIPQEAIDYLLIHSNNRRIQYLRISEELRPNNWKQLLPSLFTWESLTTLRLEWVAIPLGITFDFVSLVTLEIVNCKLWPEKNGGSIYDPFRGCLRLTTLLLSVKSDVRLNLEISAPLLADLKILGWMSWSSSKLIIASPNLSFFCFAHDNHRIFNISSASSTFPFLEKVNLDIYHPALGSTSESPELIYDHAFRLFQIMANAKIVTLSSRTIDLIFKALEDSKGCASPFVRVETFKIEVQRNAVAVYLPDVPWPYTIPDNVRNYLLSASPSARILVEDIPNGRP